MPRPRLFRVRAAAVSLLVAAAACSGGGNPGPGPASGSPATTGSHDGATTGGTPGATAPTGAGDYRLPAPSTGERSSDAVMQRLCVRPAAPEPEAIPTQRTEDQPKFALDPEQSIQESREMPSLPPAPARDAPDGELGSEREEDFNRQYPADLMERRTSTWQT